MAQSVAAWIALPIGVFVFAFPSRAAIEIAPNAFKLNVEGDRTGLLPYYSNHPVGVDNPAIKRIVVAIHSSGYDAKTYCESVMLAAAKEGETDSTLVIAPHFLRESIAPSSIKPGIVVWKGQPFWGSQQAFLSGEGAPIKISAFDVLDELIALLVSSGRLPNVKLVVVLGHSAGGQMTQRYAALNRIEEALREKGIRMRYLVMAPSSYLYFTPERYVAKTTCDFALPAVSPAGYDRYGYGLNEPYAFMKGFDAATIKAHYAPKVVLYLVGSRDVESKDEDQSVDDSPAAMLQGRTRVERATIFLAYLQHLYGAEAVASQRVVIAPGIGHYGRGLILTNAAREFLFR
jgi:pimeloyl-ACP methyl ester carboxylesterase